MRLLQVHVEAELPMHRHVWTIVYELPQQPGDETAKTYWLEWRPEVQAMASQEALRYYKGKINKTLFTFFLFQNTTYSH